MNASNISSILLNNREVNSILINGNLWWSRGPLDRNTEVWLKRKYSDGSYQWTIWDGVSFDNGSSVQDYTIRVVYDGPPNSASGHVGGGTDIGLGEGRRASVEVRPDSYGGMPDFESFTYGEQGFLEVYITCGVLSYSDETGAKGRSYIDININYQNVSTSHGGNLFAEVYVPDDADYPRFTKSFTIPVAPANFGD